MQSMRQSKYDQTYRTTRRPLSASHSNVKVWGIVGVREGKLVDNVYDPSCDVLYAVSCAGSTVFTDGDEIWARSVRSCVGYKVMADIQDDDTPSQYRGLIRTALKGYLEGAGNLLECKGRYMKMKFDDSPALIITTDHGRITVCDVSRTIDVGKDNKDNKDKE